MYMSLSMIERYVLYLICRILISNAMYAFAFLIFINNFISDSEKDLSTCFAGVRVDHVRKLGQDCVFVAPFSQQAPTQ